jgi:hypothetical protein
MGRFFRPIQTTVMGTVIIKYAKTTFILLVLPVLGILTLFCMDPDYGILSSTSRADAPMSRSSWGKYSDWEMTPEYDRHMKRIVISLAHRNTSLDLHHAFLQHLPDYTEIILLLPETNTECIQANLEHRSYAQRIRFVTYDAKPKRDARFLLLFPEKDKLVQVDTGSQPAHQQGTVWAQDLFEVGHLASDQLVLFTSVVHKYYYAAGNKSDSGVQRDNLYLNNLATVDVNVAALPLAFKGGNILLDDWDGQRVIFCGGDVFRTTRTAWKIATESHMTRSAFVELVKDVLKADRVVIVPEDLLQPAQMYHLDQAVILLPHRVAAVARIIPTPAPGESDNREVRRARQFLSELRHTLRGLGYRLVDIDLSTDNLAHCQHYVNAVPYLDPRTNTRVILMPTFLNAQTDLDREIIARNTKTFESQGYRVITVPTLADTFRGGIHCLVNVLE